MKQKILKKALIFIAVLGTLGIGGYYGIRYYLNPPMTLAEEAYNFVYPAVLLEMTQKQNSECDNCMGLNRFTHLRYFPDHSFKAIVKPNADTYYSAAWLDLGKEPVVISVPQTERYYLLPIYDAYSNIVATPGTRTTGNNAQNILISYKDWQGKVPEGFQHVKLPTQKGFIIGRTQVNSKSDGEKVVVPFQNKLTLTPWSDWMQNKINHNHIQATEQTKVSIKDLIEKMPIEQFFNLANQILAKNPPAEADKDVVERIKKIGVKAGAPFALANFDAATQEEIKDGPIRFYKRIKFLYSLASKQAVNGWVMPNEAAGRWGTAYIKRSLVAYFAWGINLNEDALYYTGLLDDSGDKMFGNQNYQIHFEKGALPPAKAFWSLAMYNKEQYFAKNEINRFSIGDRDSLIYNTDGSLDIWIQHQRPEGKKINNWLPAPNEEFDLLLRIYWPEKRAINHEWKPPVVKKID